MGVVVGRRGETDLVERKLLNRLYALQVQSSRADRAGDVVLRDALDEDIIIVLTVLRMWRDASKE